MELWRYLSHTINLFRMQCLLATNQKEMNQENTNFAPQLSDYVNQEITEFGHNITSPRETTQNIQTNMTQIHKTT